MALLLGSSGYLLLHSGGQILLSGDPGAVYHTIAPIWRTANFGNGTTTVSWPSPLDPSELKNYSIDCSVEMDGIGSRISTVQVALSPLAVTAGLMIYGVTNDASFVTVWFMIDPLERVKPNWDPPGEVHTVTCTVTSMDGEVFERTISLIIRQLGQAA